jgi:hypothetical protein
MDLPTTNDLLNQISSLRRRLRDANRGRGRTSLTLHLTRLERDKARTQARAATTDAEQQATYARRLYYQLREVMEVVRPGMEHGDIDDDYKTLIGDLRRLRSLDIVQQIGERPADPFAADPLTAEIEIVKR